MKASSKETTVAAQEPFAALAVAVHPAWHQAIIRLANASERIAFRLEAFMGTPIDGGMAVHARQLVKDIIDFLDQLDADPDLEPTAGGSCDDECELPDDAEPSLGALDRALDQVRWAMGGSDDEERDDVDDEPSLGSLDYNHSQQAWAAGGRRDREQDRAESGIGDREGLLEQIGSQDWQRMVLA